MPFHKAFLIPILIIFSLLSFSPQLLAEEEKNIFPCKDKEKILGKKTLHEQFRQGKTVSGCRVNGDDILEIIRIEAQWEEKLSNISIENSIIERGLDFSILPKIKLTTVNLPENWEEEKKKEFLKKNSTKSFRIVKNKIKIKNSEIKSKINKNGREGDYYSTFAESTLFEKDVFFDEKTIFRGDAFFKYAIFTGEASFYSATFHEVVSCYSTTFHGEAHFSSATFHKDAYFSSATFSAKASFSLATFNG